MKKSSLFLSIKPTTGTPLLKDAKLNHSIRGYQCTAITNKRTASDRKGAKIQLDIL